MSNSSEDIGNRQYGDFVKARRLRNLARIQKATCFLKEVYASGRPFFTKDAIRDLAEQIRKHGHDPTRQITIVGLDGTEAKLKSMAGYIFEDSGDSQVDTDVKLVCQAPSIHYNTVEHLTEYSDALHFSRDQAYLPLSITHRSVRRHKTTKLPVGDRQQPALDALLEHFKQDQAGWEASAQCLQLKSTLSGVDIPQTTKIIAFGCASMQQKGVVNHRSTFQHALMLTLKNILTNSNKLHTSTPTRCFAQDPAYIETDRRVLESVEIHVLTDPQGFLEMDENTVIISMNPDVPVRQIVADIARPAMMIWNTVKEDSTIVSDEPLPENHFVSKFSTDPVSSRVMDMVREYTKLEFPEDKVHFGPEMSVYVRNSTSPTD